jgi:hypothetical protein
MRAKPIAASFTVVIELLILSGVFMASAFLYDSLYIQESVLMVATITFSAIASLVNFTTFIVCALQRKTSIVRWQYFQCVTQATFCGVLLSALTYFGGWTLHVQGLSLWQEAFFIHSVEHRVGHEVAEIATLSAHVILVLVAGLCTYSCTSEGQSNLLFFNTPFFVSICVVWVVVFEAAEYGALHCYAASDIDRILVFTCLNTTLTLFFVLHVLDTLDYDPLKILPTWTKHKIPTMYGLRMLVEHNLTSMINEANTPGDIQSTPWFSEFAHDLQTEIRKQVHLLPPILAIFRCLSLVLALVVSCLPLIHMYKYRPTDASSETLLSVITLSITTLVFVCSIVLCFDYMQFMRVEVNQILFATDQELSSITAESNAKPDDDNTGSNDDNKQGGSMTSHYQNPDSMRKRNVISQSLAPYFPTKEMKAR